MKRHLRSTTVRAAALAALFPLAVPFAPGAVASSWIFRPSTFSHNPVNGDRVYQFAAKAPGFASGDGTYQQSGYRHLRSTIRGGDSADRLHMVETWGEGESIRPYGEWQYPYRAGATPFGPWGNPQGPWTTPFESWRNPYGLGRLPHPPWPHVPYPSWPHAPSPP